MLRVYCQIATPFKGVNIGISFIFTFSSKHPHILPCQDRVKGQLSVCSTQETIIRSSSSSSSSSTFISHNLVCVKEVLAQAKIFRYPPAIINLTSRFSP